jgi:hypothetical protein
MTYRAVPIAQVRPGDRGLGYKIKPEDDFWQDWEGGLTIRASDLASWLKTHPRLVVKMEMPRGRPEWGEDAY